jgi:hypothetical protein
MEKKHNTMIIDMNENIKEERAWKTSLGPYLISPQEFNKAGRKWMTIS